jgi:LemA protein
MPMLAKIAIGLAVVLALYIIWIFNRLISLKIRAANAWSDIDVQLKRRADLVPPLVETVRGYAKHESSTLQEVVQARTQTQASEDVAQRAASETQMSRQIGKLIALAEAYPDLKADKMFLSLHHQLVEVEDHLQSARRYYNAVVRDFNTLMQQFPHSAVAGVLGFKPRSFFEIEAAQASAPAVDLKGMS